MKKIIALSLVALTLAGCAHPVHRDSKVYKPYGLINEETRKDPNEKYEMSAGSVVVAIMFCETIFVPIYIIGWDLYQPIGPKTDQND